jgi:hypothetical protein
MSQKTIVKKQKTIQQMGGEATLKLHGRDHYRKMSQKALKARQKIWALAKKNQKKTS